MSEPGAPDAITIVGVPSDRRVLGFEDAAARLGLATTLLPWSDALADPSRASGAHLRIESPGLDSAAADELRRRGGHSAALAHGEIGGWQEWADGLVGAVDDLARRAASCDTTPAELAALFDKRRTRRRLAALGVPVPHDGPPAAQVLRTPGRWFVKTAHGSSASGALAVTVGRGRVEALGPLVLVDGVPFNDLALHRYRDDAADAVLTALAARGPLLVERWFPKWGMRTDDRSLTIDLRIVVVDQVARVVVARGAAGPMTNLHLGNRRVDVEAVRAGVGDATWQRVLTVAEAAAGAFPRTRCVGADVMIGSEGERVAVAEINAFGDLLPGARGGGRSAYDWQVAAWLGGPSGAGWAT